MVWLVGALVALVLAAAILRPHGLPEVAVAAPAAVIVVAVGAVTPAQALAEVRTLGPTVAFLAAILVLAHLADASGVFTWTASVLRRGSRGRPKRLLGLAFAACAITTAVLSLDATVVLLTPAILATATRMGISARPVNYAAAHLANSASTLLPVSNLTNLLAFSATGLGFLHFASLMALPWVVAIAVELAVFRLFFARDLAAPPEPAPTPARIVPPPRWALTVLGLTLLGFALSGLVGVAPAWIAVAGAVLLGVPALKEGRTRPRSMLAAADPYFAVFVLALGILVAPLTDGAVGDRVGDLLPHSESFTALLLTASVAALAANLVNNLPATLLMIGALGPGAPTGLLLAMLIGVNLGPNLTYTGSLATLLWRRVATRCGQPPTLGTFTALGVISTPLTIVGAVAALWLAL
ncbi:arsenical pump membrane protein [Rhodococcus sp. PvR044]|jgi:arsenical pump membrane protein|uniref:SLC13 family permease n=1 Tax=Rhodococcus TaxID=1827 RepID=UPI000BCA96AF|nr:MULTISPECIES: SLC13 family permease [Rhodococcus]MCZ4556857.1 ArsB/NhaD family transporter [Rhodococcus maanshanensis]PTR41966.1 arsenite efflux membrane protein ArsB [Rhodococcus sp. OK611]SNX91587.1 arsenite efflux membrane protein ArsB [Rhodococcus sp. OK270]